MKTIQIGKRTVGAGQPVFIIAEAGSNHDRKIDQAKQLVDIAKKAGADAVKFQSFLADKIVAKLPIKPAYLNKIVGKDTTMHDIFKKLEMPREWLKELAEYCRKKDIIFLSTPFDEEAVELLEEINVPAYKIASFELVHLPLLRKVARTKKPIILSTGMANLGEIEDAVRVIESEGNTEIVLLHCGINYPPRFEDIHLRAMKTMESAFNYPVGYSDHTPGIVVPVAAVALGGVMIEKHFTLDKTLPGPDHAFALNPDELIRMVESIRNTEQALGSSVKQMVSSEQELHTLARRSLFMASDISEGEVITTEKVAVLRPGLGLMPKYLDIVIGRKAKQSMKAHEPITWEKI